MFFSSDVFTIFILPLHSGELTGILSDIINLIDCVGFSDSLVLPEQVKTHSGGYLAVEKELGERNFGFDSEVQIEPRHGGERDYGFNRIKLCMETN